MRNAYDISDSQNQRDKGILAQIMATENLYVSYSATVPTARFNVKTRELTLPIWKDVPENVFNSLIGHEVAHALWTPNFMEDESNWTKILTKAGILKSDIPSFGVMKSNINITEDARIERMIKDKFWGLNRMMAETYRLFIERGLLVPDIFKPFVKGDDDMYSLIKFQAILNSDEGHLRVDLGNRLNIYAKTKGIMRVDFLEEQETYKERLDSLETWEDAVFLAYDVHLYDKENQQELQDESEPEMELEEECNDSGSGTGSIKEAEENKTMIEEEDVDTDTDAGTGEEENEGDDEGSGMGNENLEEDQNESENNTDNVDSKDDFDDSHKDKEGVNGMDSEKGEEDSSEIDTEDDAPESDKKTETSKADDTDDDMEKDDTDNGDSGSGDSNDDGEGDSEKTNMEKILDEETEESGNEEKPAHKISNQGTHSAQEEQDSDFSDMMDKMFEREQVSRKESGMTIVFEDMDISNHMLSWQEVREAFIRDHMKSHNLLLLKNLGLLSE